MDMTHLGQEEQFNFSQHEEPQYGFYLNDINEEFQSDNKVEEGAEEFHEIIYSPNQLFLLRKAQDPPVIESLDNGEPYTFRKLSFENLLKRKHSCQFERQPEKKVCVEVKIEDHSTTISEHEEEEIKCKVEDQDDLERLMNVIKLECKLVNHLDSSLLPFQPTIDQERFLLTYLNDDSIAKFKNSIDEDIVNGYETKQFLSWVNTLCSQSNVKQMKEIGRKQKVQKYLQKKYNRTYEKKVHYHIRQKVAEERLRVKGRFVTWGQALEMLNEVQDKRKSWNSVDYLKVKQLLNDKFGAARSVKSLKN